MIPADIRIPKRFYADIVADILGDRPSLPADPRGTLGEDFSRVTLISRNVFKVALHTLMSDFDPKLDVPRLHHLARAEELPFDIGRPLGECRRRHGPFGVVLAVRPDRLCTAPGEPFQMPGDKGFGIVLPRLKLSVISVSRGLFVFQTV
ncbi:hypothetical protein D3C86_1722040 [compost metagenome]